uniref:Uncharacterized protein n=1 Tax=Oryza sativa subsp. japonica TaxID=39947 RepID=Q8GVP0_ORYSJ|nr:hypothetical protein [Oryza sativa Japonica Group]
MVVRVLVVAEGADSGGGAPVTEASHPPLTLPPAAMDSGEASPPPVMGRANGAMVIDLLDADKDDGNGGSQWRRPRGGSCHVSVGVKTVVTQQGGFVTHYGRSKCGSGVSGFGQRQRTLGIAVGSICWLSSTETEMLSDPSVRRGLERQKDGPNRERSIPGYCVEIANLGSPGGGARRSSSSAAAAAAAVCGVGAWPVDGREGW